MATSAKALVEANLVAWARLETRTPLEGAARAVGVEQDRLLAWESGQDQPTVRQLRMLAKKYRVPFALFYLGQPPESHIPKFRDFRTIPEFEIEHFDRVLLAELRQASDRREVVLEYTPATPPLPAGFPLNATIRDDRDELAARLRSSLGLDITIQTHWRTQAGAFNGLRELIENNGFLVLQIDSMPLSALRGFSVSLFPLPVIVVNRKDAYAGRLFTLAHELVHVAVETSSVCDLSESKGRDPEAELTEVFCNAVAARALVPTADLVSQPDVETATSAEWPDHVLESLARRYQVSREVIVRRLLDIGRTTLSFYQAKRQQYEQEIANLPKRPSGQVPAAVDAFSLLGRRYVTTMLAALDTRAVTSSDFSAYTGLRLKHLARLRDLV